MALQVMRLLRDSGANADDQIAAATAAAMALIYAKMSCVEPGALR